MSRALIAGTALMNESEDFSRTLEEVFAGEFYPQLKIPNGELDHAIDHFYDEVFPSLSTLTTRNPSAKEFVNWAFSRGFRIAIATDPLLPRKATNHRLRWAGFEPGQFELISTFEDFHFSKTHPAYYAEVLGRLGWPEGPVLMVGNDMTRDILPAQTLGLKTFHIDRNSNSPAASQATAHGDLTGLRAWLESIDHSALVPSFGSMDSVMGILLSTPAVLSGLTRHLGAPAWSHKPTRETWSLTELACHLRDTEREIHLMQVKLFEDGYEPFIPRPDTDVWASQRDYLHENGPKVAMEFAAARKELIQLLRKVSSIDWSRKARHAIFGPTNFLENAGFMTDHDRMHIQQAWTILGKSGN
jgi:FMN phosphatase YigB (HAD superfamily)